MTDPLRQPAVTGPAPTASPHLAGPARVLASGQALILRDGDWSAPYLACSLRYEGTVCGILAVIAHRRGGGEPFRIRLGLLPGVTARLSLELGLLDGQTIFLRRSPGLLKGTANGRRLPRGELAHLELLLEDNGQPQELHLCEPRLEREDRPGVEPGPPQMDALGQWTRRDWPGRTRDEAELVRALRAAAAEPEEAPAGRNRWGGSAARRSAATGFFRTEHDGRRWWLVDPDGGAFWSCGLDCVCPLADCAVVPGTEPLYAWLPQGDPAFADAVRTGKGGLLSADFAIANLIRAFGRDWLPAWRRLSAKRLLAWGFNTIGNWSDAEIGPQAGIPWVTPMPEYPSTPIRLFRDLPDVFDPAFAEAAETWARFLVPLRDDRSLIGYFMNNEPKWGFGRFNLASEMLEDHPGSHSRRALAAWLAEHYAGDAAAWAAAWGLDASAFDAVVERRLHRAEALGEHAAADLWAFTAELVRRYAAIPAAACRRADPHHLNLGLRWAWVAHEVFYATAESCDVFSVNCYQLRPDAAQFARHARATGRPVLIGEWHVGAVDRGLPSPGLRRVDSQADRAAAYRTYIEAAAAHPDIIGAHWFTLNDQPVLGRFDGENFQIGFVDICHRPYPETVAAARASHARLYDLAEGATPPVDLPVRELPRIGF